MGLNPASLSRSEQDRNVSDDDDPNAEECEVPNCAPNKKSFGAGPKLSIFLSGGVFGERRVQ